MSKNSIKKVSLLTSYLDDTILAKDNYFPNFIIDTLNELKRKSINFDYYKNIALKEEATLNSLKAKEKEILFEINKNISFIFYYLKGTNKDRIKYYFKDKTPSKIAYTSTSTLQFLEELSKKINHSSNSELDQFGTEINNLSIELKDITKEIFNKKIDIKLNQSDIQKFYKNWENCYRKMKYYVKGFLINKDVNYKIFFQVKTNGNKRYKTINKVEENIS